MKATLNAQEEPPVVNYRDLTQNTPRIVRNHDTDGDQLLVLSPENPKILVIKSESAAKGRKSKRK